MEMSLNKIGLLIAVGLFAFVILSSAFYYISNSPIETEQTELKPNAYVFLPKGNYTIPFNVLVCTSQPNLKVTVSYDGEPLGNISTNATGMSLFTITEPFYESNRFTAAIFD